MDVFSVGHWVVLVACILHSDPELLGVFKSFVLRIGENLLKL